MGEQRLRAEKAGVPSRRLRGYFAACMPGPHLRVVAGQDQVNAGQRACRRDIDGADAGVRMGRSQHAGAKLAWRRDVVDVAALAAQQIGVFLARYRLTDAKFTHRVFLVGPTNRCLAPASASFTRRQRFWLNNRRRDQADNRRRPYRASGALELCAWAEAGTQQRSRLSSRPSAQRETGPTYPSRSYFRLPGYLGPGTACERKPSGMTAEIVVRPP